MLYTSERNTGCRFTEISLMGMRALVLENQLLHITVLLDHGADIIEFNHKRTDTDFVWRNPMGMSGIRKLQLAPVDADTYADNYLGGFFEIFPSVGGGGSYRGIRFEGYCESNQLPWEYSVLCDTEKKVTIRCFLRLNKLPLLLERCMTLTANSPVLTLDERVTNIGMEPVDYQWGWHPNIGGGFLSGDCIVDMPAGAPMQVLRPSARLGQNAAGTWPLLTEPGAEPGTGVDYSRILPPDSMHDELVDVATPAGWAAVRDPKRSLGIAIGWQGHDFPCAAIWQSSCHKTGHFRLGGAYVMCFLLHSTPTLGLPQASAAGETTPLAGGESRSTQLSFAVFEDSRPVTDVTPDGVVSFD